MKRIEWIAILAVFCASLLPIASAQAAGPNARYTADGSSLFWFMQITDTHVSTFFNDTYDDHLTRMLTEGVSTIRPWFVVVTGDLTDSTDGVAYGSGPHQEEWDEYKMLVEGAGMTPDFYFDIPGNHDSYGDGQLFYYLDNSISGRAFGQPQPYWGLSFDYGQYNFLGGAGTCNDGLQWWWDNAEYTADELAAIEAHYTELGPADFSMMFGHHPLQEVKKGGDLVDIMLSRDTLFYACGHKHDFVTEMEDGVLRYRIDSLGQGSNNNLAVYAIDNNTLSQSVVNAEDPWPLPVVTAPAPGAFENSDSWVDNPFVPGVPNGCDAAPVRVLAFDTAAVTRVAVRIDDGDWIELAQREQTSEQWRGSFDASGLSAGRHKMAVHVAGSQIRDSEIRFLVVDEACEIGEEDVDAALDDGEIILPFGPDGDIEDGDVTDGDTTDGDVEDGDIEDGDVEDGDVTDGDATDGDTIEPDGDTEDPLRLCDPGELRCANLLTVEICAEDGLSWEEDEDCEDGAKCVEGECLAEEPEIDGDIDATADGDGSSAAIPDDGASDGGCNQGSPASTLPLLLFGIWMICRRRSYRIG